MHVGPVHRKREHDAADVESDRVSGRWLPFTPVAPYTIERAADMAGTRFLLTRSLLTRLICVMDLRSLQLLCHTRRSFGVCHM